MVKNLCPDMRGAPTKLYKVVFVSHMERLWGRSYAAMKGAPTLSKRAVFVSYTEHCGKEHEGCTNNIVQGGVCIMHRAIQKKKLCSHEGCTNIIQKGGVCITHIRPE